MTLLKVCGMRDADNISELIKIKPDFIGFIFHEASSRNVIEVPNVSVPADSKKVGVFVNKNEIFIHTKTKDFKLDYIQLHGNESAEFCRKLKNKDYKIIKAFNISDSFDFSQIQVYEAYCDYFIFDAFGEKAGGNGITFNWQLLNKYKGKTPFLLSGGIDKSMSKQIKNIKHKKLVGVDINSKFEIKPAVKNIKNIKLFSDELRSR